jgi:3-hydroxybutyrate dehydrogenase
MQEKNMGRFDGKVCLVTGAPSGIGKEIALAFAREGGHAVIADPTLDGAQAAARDISAGFPEALGVAMDVSDEEPVNAGLDAAARTFGKIDVLLSNAGIQRVKALSEFPFVDGICWRPDQCADGPVVSHAWFMEEMTWQA